MYSGSNGWMQEELAHRRRQELMREAETYRLARQVRMDAPLQRNRRYLPAGVANWLGIHLVNWGNALLTFNPQEQVREQGC